ncbi:D-alanyl-D-alanine carboxypeptidase family protein [Numidum massiliense]|uniref:D-alanyl-D-alanine carboxypeptidase family protein n=1 Tax=Numidum massiliense TaxID=1522315 RepID=UPI000A8A0C85|nr:D-alanyl-D-alanine carboxypeptidase family protein [Numidum massiliense]
MIKEKAKPWLWRMTILAFILLLVSGGFAPRAQAAEKTPKIKAKSYVVMDAESGSILLAKKEDTPLPPASMTKMMAEYLVLEAIKKGDISWDQKVKVSANASKIEGSQVWLAEKEVRTVKELFTAMSVYSANDATVALAELLAGDETAFVEQMNAKAKKMGLINTHFRNSTGLPQNMYPDPPKVGGKHYMSAKDSATLARHLLQDYPEITEFSTIPEQTFRKGEPGAIDMVNWNWMIKGLDFEYEGVDGLKTGETDAAGACFTGTAKRGKMRLITVVMGTKSRNTRFEETKKLLDYGFSNFKVKEFMKKNATVKGFETVEVTGGTETEVGVTTAARVRMAYKTSAEKKYKPQVTLKGDLQAPIKKGDVVGEVTYTINGKPVPNIEPVKLVAKDDVEEASWLRLFFRSIKDIFVNFFNGIADSIKGLFS